MTLVDANILIYAYNTSSPEHPACRKWLENAMSGSEPVGLSWSAILAFLRISTNPRVFRAPMGMREATAVVDLWLGQPAVRVLEPTERHWTTLQRLLEASQASGDLVADGHLAALALEHGAAVCTTDRDFSRFAGLKLLNPLAKLGD